MKNLNNLNKYRDVKATEHIWGYSGDHECGVFYVPSQVDGTWLKILATVGFGWDHVSISRPDRCPDWDEMEQIKRLFFRDDETAMQLHVPPSEHISFHPTCLHLWRPIDGKIPMPPPMLVGPKGGKHG